MEDATLVEAVPAVVEAVNPIIAIDAFISSVGAFAALGYILIVLFLNKYKRLQIGFCLSLAALNLARLVLGIQILFPIFLGCIWLFNAFFIYMSDKRIRQMQIQNDEVLADIERMRAEINRIENTTYKSQDVWPPNPK